MKYVTPAVSFVIGVAVGTIAMYCFGDGATSRVAGFPYVPPEYAERSDVTVAEQRALDFAYRSAKEDWCLYGADLGLPNLYVDYTTVQFEPDAVSFMIGIEASIVGGGVRVWQEKATEDDVRKAVAHICERMLERFAMELKIDKAVVQVRWQLGSLASGTYDDDVVTVDQQGTADLPATP